MPAETYIAFAADTSAATGPPSAVASSATSGTVKTILQLKSDTKKFRVIEWGYTLDTNPISPLRVELVAVTATGTITVTSLGSGAIKYGNSGDSASMLVASTSKSGFNASAEGTITASRLLDYQYENGLYFKKQFPLGREPEIISTEYLRIRVTPTSSAAVNIMPYIVWEE